MDWPDLVTCGITLFAAFAGWRRGFISELMGFLALIAALAAALHYGGEFDGFAENVLHAGTGSRHIVGLLAFAAAAYLLVFLAGLAANRIAKFPLFAIVNAAAGAALGAGKALLLIWGILYVALLFPMAGDLRAELHRSVFVGLFAARSAQVDDAVSGALPDYLRPLFSGAVSQHRNV